MPRARLALSALPALALLAGTAAAQPQPPGGVAARPVFSPYLSLANRGASPALNYFGFVRPQQQALQQNAQLQQQLNAFDADAQNSQLQSQQLAAGILDALLPSTGNVATFNNTGGYFNRIGGGAGGIGGLGGNRAGGAAGPQPSFARPAGGGATPRSQGGGARPQTGVGGGGAPGVRR